MKRLLVIAFLVGLCAATYAAAKDKGTTAEPSPRKTFTFE